ncbi:MAG: TIGR02266 family protein [Myxococcales bacterium]|nr:TIGR02266 family protein [Myxococcales bacterium]MCB9712486.1 TIGR02266 family protein [Myxococcales bacterium]
MSSARLYPGVSGGDGNHDEAAGAESSGDDPRGRRKDLRVGLVLPLEYRNAGHLLVSYCTNLSKGGLFLPTPEPLAKGEVLTLSLRIPGRERALPIEARVRWVRRTDSDRGPAGMGVAFHDVDGVLGDTIDAIVARFVPLRVDLVGARPAAWHHVAALLRSLLTCETHEHRLAPELAPALREADLVVVDLERFPERGMVVLEELGELPRPPPRIALCPGRDDELRPKAAALARVVPTPIDNGELRHQVLEAVSEVHARWPEEPTD